MKVLVVDDNSAVRQAVRELLCDIAEVYECSDGAEVLQSYATWQPDWVLMDIKMKVLDGLAATQEIKAAFPTAQIIIVTGYADASLREAAHKAGACGYVLKENLFELGQMLKPSATRS